MEKPSVGKGESAEIVSNSNSKNEPMIKQASPLDLVVRHAPPVHNPVKILPPDTEKREICKSCECFGDADSTAKVSTLWCCFCTGRTTFCSVEHFNSWHSFAHNWMAMPTTLNNEQPLRLCKVCPGRKYTRFYCPACPWGVGFCSLDHYKVFHEDEPALLTALQSYKNSNMPSVRKKIKKGKEKNAENSHSRDVQNLDRSSENTDLSNKANLNVGSSQNCEVKQTFKILPSTFIETNSEGEVLNLKNVRKYPQPVINDKPQNSGKTYNFIHVQNENVNCGTGESVNSDKLLGSEKGTKSIDEKGTKSIDEKGTKSIESFNSVFNLGGNYNHKTSNQINEKSGTESLRMLRIEKRVSQVTPIKDYEVPNLPSNTEQSSSISEFNLEKDNSGFIEAETIKEPFSYFDSEQESLDIVPSALDMDDTMRFNSEQLNNETPKTTNDFNDTDALSPCSDEVQFIDAISLATTNTLINVESNKPNYLPLKTEGSSSVIPNLAIDMNSDSESSMTISADRESSTTISADSESSMTISDLVNVIITKTLADVN